MELIAKISVAEFNQEIMDSKEKVFFLTKRNGNIVLKDNINLEEYEDIVRRVLFTIIKRQGFSLEKFFFLKRKKLFMCKVNNLYPEEKVNFSKMKLRDFILCMEEESISIDLLNSLRKFEKQLGGEITLEDIFSNNHYILLKLKQSNLRELSSILEYDIILDEGSSIAY